MLGTRKLVDISYANEKYIKVSKLNRICAIRVGRADRAIIYTPNDIDADFTRENKEILSASRGNEYWLWKPYFIKKTLEQMNEAIFNVIRMRQRFAWIVYGGW